MIRGLLTVGLVWAVLRRANLASVVRTFADMGSSVALLALVFTLGSPVVSAWRWHRVLAHLGTRVPVGQLLADTLVGTAYNIFLPTSVGGDVMRSMRCAKRVSQGELAWASVMFERIMGLIGLALVSALGMALTWSTQTRPLLGLALLMAGSLTVGLLIAPLPLGIAARATASISRNLSDFLTRLARTFAGPLAGALPRFETLAWSLVYQGVALTVLIVPALGWQEPRLLEAVYLGIPVALILATAPITIGGFGLRESLFVLVLEPFGFTAERALALSVVWLASNLTVGLGGLGVLLWGRR